MRTWFDASNERALDAAPIAAILVVIAGVVSLAQTWGGPDPGAPAASETVVQVAPHDGGSDGDRDWVRVTLLLGGDTPHAFSSVVVVLGAPHEIPPPSVDPASMCESPVWDPGDLFEGTAGACANPVESAQTWEVGASLYVPCQRRGAHVVAVSLGEETLPTARVWCDRPP